MAQSSQCVAARAHPLFAVRSRIGDEAGHADVFPRRSVVLSRSDLQFGPRRARAPASDFAVRYGPHRTRVGIGLSVRHRPAWTRQYAVRGASMTPSQTVGPFFAFSLTAKPLGQMAGPDAIVELWQADASGKYEHPEDMQPRSPDPAFCGFGRLGTDEAGTCRFETIRPGRVPGLAGDQQAPHINVIVLARGMLSALFTRIYFADDPANAEDAALALVPEDRRSTLLAQPDAAQPGVWNFDIHLSGDRETVFFDL